MAMDPYDDQSGPATAQDNQMGGDGQDQPEKSDETEDQLALVPNHFFKRQPDNPLKPGQREEVEIVQIYEGESSIKCVSNYDKKDKNEHGEGTPAEENAPDEESEGSMY